MNIESIKRKLNPILEKEQLILFSIKTKREFGENILEILIDGNRILSETLESIHVQLLSQLSDDDLDPRFFLELSSVGIERPIQNEEDMKKAIGKYIYIESSKYRGNATFLELKDDILLVEINDKGRIRKIEIKKESIHFMRHAIKF